MTNGEKLIEVFPSIGLYKKANEGIQINFNSVWFNAEYKEPTTKNDLGVDYISRADVLKLIYDYKDNHFENREKYPINYGTLLDMIRWVRALPSVTPQEPKWIPASERLPTKEEYIANNGLFIVTDGNRTYAEYFNVYNSMKYFGEPTMNGFRVDRCVIAWMPLPKPYKAESEE